MGRRGPAPIPTNLRILHGETKPYRVSRNEPIPRDVLPQCPPEASAATRKVWDYTMAELVPMGLATAADRDALLCYCEAVVTHRKASQCLIDEGILVAGLRGTVVRNPALQIQRDSAQLIRSYAHEFGLTPSARQSISTAEAGHGNPAERLLS